MERKISLTSTDDLLQKGQAVLNAADDFKSTLDSANKNVKYICDNWDDDNGRRFSELYADFASKFDKLYADLQNMGNTLNKEARELNEMLAYEQQQLNGNR